MRYTHNLALVRRRQHSLAISLTITAVLIVLIIFLGFTTLDASQFFFGFFLSFSRVLAAYGFAMVIAMALLLLATSSPAIESIAVPILDALQSFPSFALFPLLIVWFGKSSLDVIIVLVIEMVWPILFSLLTAKKQLREDTLEAASIYQAKGWRFFRYVFLPLLFPSLVTGSIVAWGEAWETVIGAEIIVKVMGVGSYLSQSGERGQTQILLIGIVLLLAILFILNKYIFLPLLNLSTKYQQET